MKRKSRRDYAMPKTLEEWKHMCMDIAKMEADELDHRLTQQDILPLTHYQDAWLRVTLGNVIAKACVMTGVFVEKGLDLKPLLDWNTEIDKLAKRKAKQ